MGYLIRMRLTGYAKTQRVLAPTLAALVLLGIMYGGGQALAAEAYGTSAVVLFPVLAWQAKILLDVEPDVQRRLATVAVGGRSWWDPPRREVAAGLIAAALTAVPTVVVALVVPWVVGGVKAAPDGSGPPAFVVGVWAHLLAVPPAVALGAWASRAVTRTAGVGVSVLVGGLVAALVLGLHSSPVPWLAPPLVGAARAAATGLTTGPALALAMHALLWGAAGVGGYVWLRRYRG